MINGFADGSSEYARPATRSSLRFTEIMCPICGHRIGSVIRLGEVFVYCRKCRATINVTIEVVDKKSPSVVSR